MTNLALLTEFPQAQVLPENFYHRFYVTINFKVGKPLVGDILDLPGKINVYISWNIILYKEVFHTLGFISKFSERASLQTSLYNAPTPSQNF